MNNPSNRIGDQELMRRIQSGDGEALHLLMNQHRHQILNLCYRYLNNQEDAEEVTQDVFIRLFRSAGSYEPRAKLSTFLYRIAVNLSLNKIRDRKLKRFLSLHSMSADERSLDPASDEDQPDVALERTEKIERIRKVISSLPESQRTTVILHRFQELSYEEIAEVMECSVSAVESRLHRAKLALQKKLSPLLGE